MASDFFKAGLTDEMLNTQAYVSLCKIMQFYECSKDELCAMYNGMEANSIEEHYWVLKLIKMKGRKDFVEDALRRLCC
jgi:hypothetical protein